jgi:hypothetical protein
VRFFLIGGLGRKTSRAPRGSWGHGSPGGPDRSYCRTERSSASPPGSTATAISSGISAGRLAYTWSLLAAKNAKEYGGAATIALPRSQLSDSETPMNCGRGQAPRRQLDRQLSDAGTSKAVVSGGLRATASVRNQQSLTLIWARLLLLLLAEAVA